MELYSYNLLDIPNIKNIIDDVPVDDDRIIIQPYTTKRNNKYKIIKYNKDLIDNDTIDTIGRIRSVVLNSENKVVSISPSKSLKIDTFFHKYPEPTEYVIGEQFVEGTMINLFWDPSIGIDGAWEISTRNTVGGEMSFYKSNSTSLETWSNENETRHNKTFKQMFLDACTNSDVRFSLLNQEYCYSFVLQHPDNRIVVPFVQTQLYLVEIYKIEHTIDSVNIKGYSLSLATFNLLGFSSTLVQIPKLYEYKKYNELIDTYASNNTSYEILGVVFKNLLTGERTKKRNPVYEEIKQLRGNQPKIQYQYLCLRKEGKVKQFLEYFPEYKNDFAKFRAQLHDFTNTLFSNYKECFVRKQKKHIDFPFQYRHHMFVIHSIYREELLSKKLFITNTDVIKYVNSLHPSQQMYSLNYNLRKRIVDFIRADDSNDV